MIMASFVALLLAATPLTAPLPPGVSAVAGVQVEIVRAERVNATANAGSVHRNVRRVAGGLIIDFN